MIIVSKEEGAKWPNLGSKGELRGFYGTPWPVSTSNLSALRVWYLILWYSKIVPEPEVFLRGDFFPRSPKKEMIEEVNRAI